MKLWLKEALDFLYPLLFWAAVLFFALHALRWLWVGLNASPFSLIGGFFLGVFLMSALFFATEAD